MAALARAPGDARPTIAELLLAAEERMELTDEGWVEKVAHPAHGRMDMAVGVRLTDLRVSLECLYVHVRLTAEPNGNRYVPDLFVVLPSNPVPVEEQADYGGAPDLLVETLSPSSRDRDYHEKRRAYAARGVPHYWLADPDTRQVTWLRLVEARYVEQWTRPLDEVELPWSAGTDPG
jgi:Uma2 family endonuclease